MGRSSRPLDKGGGGGVKFFFRPFRPQFGPKKRGGPGLPGPAPGSASELPTKSENSIQILSLFKSYETVEENNHPESAPKSLDCYGNSKVITVCQ